MPTSTPPWRSWTCCPSLATAKTFPIFVEALIQGSPRVIAGVSWALTSSHNYPPSLLMQALATPGVSKSAVLEVINAQRNRFSVRELLTAAYAQEANEKNASVPHHRRSRQ